MLSTSKRYSRLDRYSLPLAGIHAVLLITAIFYCFVLVRETASANTGNYKFQPIFFSNVQGWFKSEEPLSQFEREKVKLQESLLYFSHDFIAAILKYFWRVPSQSINHFLVQGAAVILVLDEYEEIRSDLAIYKRPQEIEEQMIFEEVNRLVLQLIDMNSPPYQIVAMQRKGLLLMKLINHGLIAQTAGLSEVLILEIETDLSEFEAILNAFKFGNNNLKIDVLLDQRAQKSLSVIENAFEPIKQSALKLLRQKTIFFEFAESQREKIGAVENLILASKQLDSQLNGTFSNLTTSANVLAILILEILISVSFLLMNLLKEGARNFNSNEKSGFLEPVLEENMNSLSSRALSPIMSNEAEVIFDTLEGLLIKQVNDLQSVSDFDDQLKSFRAKLTVLVGVFEFFRLESYKQEFMHIVQILEESEKNRSLDSEKLSELIIDLQNILDLVSLKGELGSVG